MYITAALYYSDVISLEYVYVLYVRTYTFRFVKKAGTPMNKSHTVTVNKGTKTKLKMNFSADRQYARPRGPRSRLVRCFLRYSDMKVMTKFQ